MLSNMLLQQNNIEKAKGIIRKNEMRILMLYGVNCTKEIWDVLNPYVDEYDIDYVEYPHEISLNATKVETLTEWVFEKYHVNSYDAVIGHSLGGVIALQLVANYGMNFKKIIYLDTNLKPAGEFYRNLMTPQHMEKYGKWILSMLKEERAYYNPELIRSIQNEFDYTSYVRTISQKIFAIYGDRGTPDYANRISDLNLDTETLNKLEIKFVQNSCHMMMIENPEQLSELIRKILVNDQDSKNQVVAKIIKKISTHLLTLLTMRAIVHVEQRKRDDNQRNI